jgi:hypothetical protein
MAETSGYNKEYLRQRLLQLAILDVKNLLTYEHRKGLIKSVFYQMDWRNENVCRQEVVDIWMSVTKEVNAELKPKRLIHIVRSGDENKDGVINLKEFIKISEDIIDEIERSYEEKLQAMIAEARCEAFQDEAAALDELHLTNPSQAPIPWGWAHVPPDFFRDIISGFETRNLPEID